MIRNAQRGTFASDSPDPSPGGTKEPFSIHLEKSSSSSPGSWKNNTVKRSRCTISNVAVTSIRKRAEVAGYVGKSVSGSWKRDAQSSRNPWNEFQDLSWKLVAMILRTRYIIELVRDRRPGILIFLAGAKRNHPVKSTRHDRFMRKVLIVLRKREELSPWEGNVERSVQKLNHAEEEWYERQREMGKEKEQKRAKNGMTRNLRWCVWLPAMYFTYAWRMWKWTEWMVKAPDWQTPRGK